MAKQGALGARLYLAGYDHTNDVGAVSRVGGGPVALDVTGIDKGAPERVGGQRDGGIDFAPWFNPAAGKIHARLSLLPTTDQVATFGVSGALGDPAASVLGKQLNYDGTRGQDGAFSFGVTLPGNGFGLEWGRWLTTASRTDSAATNGTSVDLGAASPGAFGLQAYLHVFAFAGTDVTVKIQESSDNGAGDAFADVVGGGFTQITSSTPQAQRIATAAINVERYLRVVTVTSTSFSNLVFAVMAVRNDTATVF